MTSSCTIVTQCTGVVPMTGTGLYRRTSPSGSDFVANAIQHLRLQSGLREQRGETLDI
jgi:hypothetical protein